MSRAKGTYSLLLELTEPTRITVGALGSIQFPSGYYVYTGSAFGAGGFGRIDRHHRVHIGKNQTRHWHIDYLLPHVKITQVFRAQNVDDECGISDRLPGDPIRKFGSSDCTCPSHLRHTPTKHRLETALTEEYYT